MSEGILCAAIGSAFCTAVWLVGPLVDPAWMPFLQLHALYVWRQEARLVLQRPHPGQMAILPPCLLFRSRPGAESCLVPYDVLVWERHVRALSGPPLSGTRHTSDVRPGARGSS